MWIILRNFQLNAVSSRSHAILGIKLMITTGDQTRISTASAIDLAGSEDNRRTENQRERKVEYADINKSLFTVAKCVDISRQALRIPYRESKLTRLLDIGRRILDYQTLLGSQAMCEDLASLEAVFNNRIICLQEIKLTWKSI